MKYDFGITNCWMNVEDSEYDCFIENFNDVLVIMRLLGYSFNCRFAQYTESIFIDGYMCRQQAYGIKAFFVKGTNVMSLNFIVDDKHLRNVMNIKIRFNSRNKVEYKSTYVNMQSCFKSLRERIKERG
ncbi:hypothetical protein D3C81_767760 [compost metagenome]